MTIEEALKKVREIYEKADATEYVRQPVAYALYTVWRAANQEEEKKK